RRPNCWTACRRTTAVRVVSLVPSVTESLLAMGVTPVAVTRFCEQPGLPTVGGTKDPDVAAIVALGPDLVVVDEEENRREDADEPTRYPEVTLDQARARGPDVVLAPSEPYPFRRRHVPELEQVAPVELVDGRDLFWWGVRTPAAIARLGPLGRLGLR